MKIRTFLFGAALTIASAAQGVTIDSPTGKIRVETSTDGEGRPVYTVTHEGRTVISDAPLGLRLDFADLSRGLRESAVSLSRTARSYTQDKIKRSRTDVTATSATIGYEGEEGKRLTMEWHVADDGVAFRYLVPRQQERGSMVVAGEASAFRFPEGTRTWLTSQCEPMTGWKRTKPSYEEYYQVDAPMETVSEYGRGYTFPGLFRTPEGVWTLVTETDVDGYYCGSHLSDYEDGCYRVAYPMAEENNGNGNASPGVTLPGRTPWRVMAISDSLAPIVETTLPWDLVEPRYEARRPARAGKGTWSWILWQDESINYDDQKRYIDLAAELGYDNVLIDNWWDKNIGEKKMEELIGYAHSKGVHPILWFSSSGHWNDIVQGPINRMDRPIVRKKWMKWMEGLGVDAIKVDFFGGDKQETMRLYEDILSDAADHGIDVVFHGCTLPRGWERMYPNFVGAEAVLASENMIFDQRYCDREALQATLHPFIRNSAAIMEYGGTFLNKRMNRGNDGGNVRRTTDAFQLATAVLFQNPVQNFALAPNNLEDAPRVAIDFMKEVPTTWDDTRYVAGEPGKLAVIARRHGDEWYIAGVSNLKEPVTLNLDVPMIGANSKLRMINDGENDEPTASEITVSEAGKISVTLNPQSGFVARR